MTPILFDAFNVLAADNPLTHVVDQVQFQIGDWWIISNHTIMMLIAAALMVVVFITITRPYRDGKHVPTGTRNFFEAIMIYVRDDVAKPVLGQQTTRFIPYLWTLFFFILFMNLLGLVPLDLLAPLWEGLGLHHAIYGTATANLTVTAALAIVAFFVIHICGIRDNGLKAYGKHFLAGAPWWMFPVMVPVEILGMFIKPFALLVRLWANMTAGHVLIAVLISFSAMAYRELGTSGAIAIGIPVVLAGIAVMCLEVFVAFLQAYIFTMLTALFIGQMVLHEHDENEHHEEHDEAHETVGSGDLTDYAQIPMGNRSV